MHKIYIQATPDDERAHLSSFTSAWTVMLWLDNKRNPTFNSQTMSTSVSKHTRACVYIYMYDILVGGNMLPYKVCVEKEP